MKMRIRGRGTPEVLAVKEEIESMLESGYGYTYVYKYLKENNKITIKYSQFHLILKKLGIKSLHVKIKSLLKEGRDSDIISLLEQQSKDIDDDKVSQSSKEEPKMQLVEKKQAIVSANKPLFEIPKLEDDDWQ